MPDELRADKIRNSVERRAVLLLDAMEAMAQRIAEATDEPPMDSLPVSPQQERAMFQFSPYGAQAAAMFWEVHDGVLGQLIVQAGGADALDRKTLQQLHFQAEQQALRQVYPQRAVLAGIGQASIEVQVKRASRLRRLADQQEGADDGADA